MGHASITATAHIYADLQGFVAENPLTGKGLGFSSIAIKALLVRLCLGTIRRHVPGTTQ
jgi:hypothetical protein